MCGAHLESINFSKHQSAVPVFSRARDSSSEETAEDTPPHTSALKGGVGGVLEDVVAGKPWERDGNLEGKGQVPGTRTCHQEGLHKPCGC